MKKIKYIIATIFIVAIGTTIFWACQKENDKIYNPKNNSIKNQKSMGNYQQPTQIVEIHTVINVGEAGYPISGNAVVGNYDGRIYECDLIGVIHVVETDEVFAVHLTAVLKPEFEDIMIDVEPVMENYIITVNGIPFNQDFILIFPINTSFIEITYPDILNLWAEIVEICTTNTVIVYPFVLHESMLPYQYAVYEHDFPMAFVYIWTTLDSYAGGERGYFMLSFDDANAFLHYGFVTESTIHFDPSVFVDDPNNPPVNIDNIDDDDYDTMYGCKLYKVIITKSENRAERWCERQIKNGYEIIVTNLGNGWIKCEAAKNCK